MIWMVNAMRCIPTLILTMVLLLTASCSTKAENIQPVQTPTTDASSTAAPTPEAVKPTPTPPDKGTLAQSVRNKSRLVLDAIKAKNLTQLAAYTHPDLGVCNS
jgi:hypothetical protein